MAQPEKTKDDLILPDNLENCHSELEAIQHKLDETTDKYLRAAAQVDNVRKWTERDVRARSKEDLRNLMRQFLEVMDNLERAISQPGDPAMLYQGLQLTQKELAKAFLKAGVEEIDVEPGQLFDPSYHEGIGIVYGEVDQPTVGAVILPGYRFENELLRPARVTVIKPVER